jgi:PAS domain S-box-containing protein
LVALHAGSDMAIAIAYFSIPVAMVWFVRKRGDFEHWRLAYLFAAFILTCGATHLLSILTLWVPAYGIEGLVKALTAALSIATAIVLWPLAPRLLALPSPELLVALNAELSRRVAAQEETTARLLESESLMKALNADLERRVAERTSALEVEVAARRDAERKFRQVIEFAPAAMVTCDGEGTIELLNNQTELTFGYSREELLGRSVDILLPDRLRASHGHDVAKYFASLTPRDMGVGQDLSGRRKDGSEFPVEIGVNILKTPEGQELIFSITDITERKETEKALSESELQRRLMFDNIRGHAIFLLDPEGRVITWNSGAETLKGFKKEDILGRHFSMLYPPEDIANGKPHGELIVAAKEGRVEDEGWRVRKDGSRFMANVVINAVKDSRGDLRGFVKVTRDVTERRRIESQLIETNRRFALAAGAARLGFWELEIETLLLTWDVQMFELYGLPFKEGAQPNLFWKERIHPEDRARTEARVRLAMQDGRDFEIEYRIVRPDGGVRHVRSAATVERNADGLPTRLFGVNFDITESKQLETALIEANERFALAAEAAGMGFYDFDVETEEGHWDVQTLRLYDIPPESAEHPYAVIESRIHPDDRDDAEKYIGEAIERMCTISYEFRVVRSDGQIRHLRGAACVRRHPTTGRKRMYGVKFDITERKRAEIELIEANERFALAAQAAGVGFYDVDIETRVSRWDDQMFRLYGVSPEIGEEPFAIWQRSVHPDDRAAAEQRVRDAITRPGGYDYEFRIVQPDGGIRHIRGAATAKQDPNTGRKRMFGLNFDITERKRIEMELIAANERFGLAAQAAKLGVWDLDVSSMAMRWDDQMFRLYGRERIDDAQTNALWRRSLHPDDREKAEQAALDARTGGQYHETEFRIVRPDGEVRHLQAAASLLRDGAGVPTRLVGVNFDITERKRIETELTQSNERFVLAAEAGGLGVWDYDVEAQTLRWDDQMYRLYGLERMDGDQPFALWAESLHPDDREGAEKLAREAIEGVRGYQDEFRIVWPNGAIRYLRAAASVRRNAAGRATRFVGVNFDITERKRIESELIESNKRFAVAAEAAGLGFWENYVSKRTVYWDDQMFKIRGGVPVKGNRYAEQFSYVHPDDKEKVEQELREAGEGRKKFNCEYRIVLRDGQVKHMKSAASLQGEPGSIDARLLGVSFDITERKEIEDKVVQANLRFALAAEAAELGFWEYDMATQTLHWDARMFRLYGVESRDEAQPYDLWATRLHPDDRARAEEEVRAAASGGRKFDTEFRIIRPDGEVRHLRAAATLSRDAKSGAARMFGVNFDITERKRIENKLLEANERFVLAAEAAGLGFWEYEIDSQTSYWDDQMYRLYGLERAAGHNVAPGLRYVHADDRARVENELRDAIAGLRSFDSEYRVVQPDGRVRHLRGAASLKRDQTGRGVSLLGVSFDVTERKEALQALEQARDAAEAANRAKSAFLASMSHEIRTPMNGVLGFADLLLDGNLTEQQRMHLTRLQDAAKSLLSLMNDILDLSKIEAGKLQIETIPTNPTVVVHGAVSVVRRQIAAKGLDLRIEGISELPLWVESDPTRLRQILLNLLSNALKFTDSGWITIRCSRETVEDQHFMRFEIEDTGIGIPDDRLHLLFRDFSQIDTSTTRRYGGTGLGLSICKRLVRAMGGEIGVRSVPGAGTTIWFTIAFRACQPPVPSETSDPTTFVANPARILLADDLEMNRDIVEMMLKRAGHSVRGVGNGRQAVAAVQESDFDVVLMDMEMPEMDGVEATRTIRRLDERIRHIPIVALTANAFSEDQRRCREAGMNDFLPKPITFEGLLAMVAKWSPGSPPKTAETAPTTPLVLDLEILKALDIAVGVKDAARFSAKFRKQAGNAVAALKSTEDPAFIAREAHKLVNLAGNLGCAELAGFARNLCSEAKRGNSSVHEMLSELPAMVDRAVAALAARYP